MRLESFSAFWKLTGICKVYKTENKIIGVACHAIEQAKKIRKLDEDHAMQIYANRAVL